MTGFDLGGVSDIRFGSNPVDVYLGGTKIWPRFTVQNFPYTGDVQSCDLPAGRYKLQCWGAQGSSNPADGTYGITAQAGGKGGYSEGVLTLASAATVYVFVGGQPDNSDNHGGWNGGGGGASAATNGADTDTAGLGVSRMGRGGGGTDIALVTSMMNWSNNRTNRSSASLLSRFIVAGGGGGGAMALKRKTTSTTSWQTVGTMSMESGTLNGHSYSYTQFPSGSSYFSRFSFVAGEDVFQAGDKIRITTSDSFRVMQFCWVASGQTTVYMARDVSSTPVTADYIVCPGSGYNMRLQLSASSYYTGTILIEKEVTTTSTTDTYASQTGYAGGGVNGDGYSSSYYGQQDAAGYNGGFGYGAGVSGTAYRYISGRGGGGWYGGGNAQTNTDNISFSQRSGGGSGFVNTSGNAQYRPTDFTGLELDSGTTYDGTQTFEAVNGGTETGHEGNGYARITRL